MRPFFWVKIADKDTKDTLWTVGVQELGQETDEAGEAKEKERENENKRHIMLPDVDMDFASLSKFFCKDDGGKAGGKAGGKGGAANAAEAKTAQIKAGSVSLLDQKRAQNAGIGLARLKLTVAEARRALLTFDENVLSLDRAKVLRDVMPNGDEVDVYRSFEGELRTLSKLDKFFLEVSQIQHAKERVDAIIAKMSFASLAMALRASIDVVNRAVATMYNSKTVLHAVSCVLAMGNYMNGGTRRGGAYGFKLSTLLKLGTTKANTSIGTVNEEEEKEGGEGSGSAAASPALRPQSLLHLLANHMMVASPELLVTCKEDLRTFEAAARVNGSQLRQELMAVKQCVNALTKTTKWAPSAEYPLDEGGASTDPFMLKVVPFLEQEANPTAESLIGDVEEAIRVVDVVANDFGDKSLAEEESGGIKMFVLLKSFLAGLDKAARDNDNQRVAALKAKKSKARGLQTRKKVALAAVDKNGRPQSIRDAIKTSPMTGTCVCVCVSECVSEWW